MWQYCGDGKCNLRPRSLFPKSVANIRKAERNIFRGDNAALQAFWRETRGILRDNDGRFPVTIELRTVVPTSALALYFGLSPKSPHSQALLQIHRGYFYKCRFALVSHLHRIARSRH